MAQYSNLKAMLAMTKASLQSIMKSPSAIVFTLAFPMVFILVFGFIGGGSGFHFSVADTPGCDTTSKLYSVLHRVNVLKWVEAKDTSDVARLFKDGDIVATIGIRKQADTARPEFVLDVNTVTTAADKAQQLKATLATVIEQMDPTIQQRQKDLLEVNMHMATMREYKTIDFILPGQLSFSLLASAVFGTAFVFFNLRQTLVLKRFFATPVRREIIILSEGLARMIFQIMGTILIILVGHYFFGFTLIHGIITFIEMILVSAISLLIFMGFGFIISGIAKSESAIPPLSNLITLPQFLLAGTFFSIDNFPKWLQPFCRALPLTYLNDALRKIAFDGANLWDIKLQMGVLLLWGVVVYLVAGKTFKWE